MPFVYIAGGGNEATATARLEVLAGEFVPLAGEFLTG